MSKKLWMAPASILFIAILAVSYYNFTYLPIWGFHLNKHKIQDVIIMTQHHSYMVTDHDAVMNIAKEASVMAKGSRDLPNLFPTKSDSEKYIKIMIQLKNFDTYGSHIWKEGTDLVLHGNGYFYRMDYKKMEQVLDDSLPQARVLN